MTADTPAGPLSWPPASRVGPYRIGRRLGSGGMGVVYLGSDAAGGQAAVKLIRPEHTANPQLRARLRREVAAARRVPRFCTAPVLDADLDADPPWVATEYIDGPSLDAALLERGRLTGAVLETFAVGVAVALRAIHQQGVVHRDLKPSNILLSTLGPRVIDFGIAQVEGDPTRLTRTGTIVGTPAYMAPEQLRGDPITSAVDVFAWASLVTYAATGRPPFGSGAVPLRAVLYDDPDLGELAGPLRDLVAAALHKDPAARPTTAELVDELSRMAPATTTQVINDAAAVPPAVAPPPATGPRERRTRRRVGLAAAGTAVVLVGVATLVALLPDGSRPGGQDPTRSRQLAAQALATEGSDPRRALELALEAWAAGRTAEARGALLSLSTQPYAGRLGTDTGGTSVAVDPAGETVAVGHADGTVRLWDATTLRPLTEPLTGHGGTVHRAVFSPDGTLLATASLTSSGENTLEQVRVWEAPSGRPVRTLPGLATVAWLPDGRSLIAAQLDTDAAGAVIGGLRVYDVESGRDRATIDTDRVVLDLAVSPDGTLVAGGHDDGTAGVWRLADGDRVAELTGHAEGAVRVAFSGDGELATVGLDGEIRLWPVPAAEDPRTLGEGAQRTIGRLTFTPDGHLLATGGGPALQSFDVASGQQVGRLVGFDGTPVDVAAAADGKLVAATGPDGTTTLWRRATYWLPHPDAVLDVAFDPSGQQFATAASDGTLRLWDRRTVTLAADQHRPTDPRSLTYAPDGTLASTWLDGTVRLYGRDGQEHARVSVADGLEAHGAVFSPDGALLAVSAAPPFLGGGDEEPDRIYLWQHSPLRPRGVVDLGPASAGAMAFTPDGSQLLATTYTAAAVSGDPPEHSELRTWNTADLTPVGQEDLGAQQAVHLTIDPTRETLAIGGTRRTIQLRPLGGDGPARELAEHPATIRRLAFSPDGEVLATITADDPVIRLWEVASGELLAALTGHGEAPNAIAFSPDGTTLASGGPDTFAVLWTVDPGTAVQRICRALGPPEPDPAPHPACA